MALEKATKHTRRTTIVLDNQGVVLDLQSNSHSISSLDNCHRTFKILNCLHLRFPGMQTTVRWCPGHQGIPGNDKVDKIANSLAKQPLPDSFANRPNTAAFIAAIKEWRKDQTELFTDKDRIRLGHQPQPRRHLEGLTHLLKHEVATLTQLRSGHVPLNSYLNRFVQITDPMCDCQEGIENVDHFLFVCQNHDQNRDALVHGLQEIPVKLDKRILSNPNTFKSIATYCNSTWRFANRWTWARATDQPVPLHKQLPLGGARACGYKR